MSIKQHKSSIFDLNANVMSMIAYIGGAGIGVLGQARYVACVIPLVIYFLEKNSTFVRKNTVQSITLNILTLIIYTILGIIGTLVIPKKEWNWNVRDYEVISGSPFISGAVSVITWIMIVSVAILSVLAMIRAYKYEEYEIPFINKISPKIEMLLNKIYNESKTEKVEVAEKVEKEDKK